MKIEEAFIKLTGNTHLLDSGKRRGTTKSEVRELCGEDWNEYDWLKTTALTKIVLFTSTSKTWSMVSIHGLFF